MLGTPSTVDSLQLAAFAALGFLALLATPAFVDHRNEHRTLLSGLGEPPVPPAAADPTAASDDDDDRTADAEDLTERDRVEYPPDETDEG